MGQYHILVNLDKKQKVEPYNLGLGLKQWEHLGEFNGTLADAMYLLCMTSPARGGGDLPRTEMSGAWAGDRVVVVGDYTEDTDLPDIPNAKNLYREADNTYDDVSEEVAHSLEQAFNIKVTSSWIPVREESQ
jgi:hypothetical protein